MSVPAQLSDITELSYGPSSKSSLKQASTSSLGRQSSTAGMHLGDIVFGRVIQKSRRTRGRRIAAAFVCTLGMTFAETWPSSSTCGSLLCVLGCVQ